MAAACRQPVETPTLDASDAPPHPTAGTIGGFSHGPGAIRQPAWSSCSRRNLEEGSWTDPADTSPDLKDRVDGWIGGL